MGIAYRCQANLRCTFVVWDGEVTPERWSDQIERIVRDPAFPPGPLLLGDLSTVFEAPDIDNDVIEEMARRWRANAADLALERCAVVANVAWDKARRFVLELEGSGVSSMVFNEHWAACTWLGLDTEAARTILRDLRATLRP